MGGCKLQGTKGFCLGACRRCMGQDAKSISSDHFCSEAQSCSERGLAPAACRTRLVVLSQCLRRNQINMWWECRTSLQPLEASKQFLSVANVYPIEEPQSSQNRQSFFKNTFEAPNSSGHGCCRHDCVRNPIQRQPCLLSSQPADTVLLRHQHCATNGKINPL